MSDQVIRYQVSTDEIDEAANIFLQHTQQSLDEMIERDIDVGAAVQAVVQMSMRTYADLIRDDQEAIRQIRVFLDGWETALAQPAFRLFQ